MVEQDLKSEGSILEQFDTAEINPQQFADFLGVRLEKESDVESTSRIHLYYGQPNPVLVLRFNPEKRKIIVGVYSAYDPKPTYRYSAAYNNIDSLHFVRYQSRGSVRSDICIRCRWQDGTVNCDGIISNTDHLSS